MGASKRKEMATVFESDVIAGVVVVEPDVHGDERGRFVESYRRSWLPAGREMVQSIVDARSVWLNGRTKCYAQKIDAREVRIDQQSVSFEFELVAVRAEISHAHAVTRCRARIVHYQLRVMIKSGTKRLRTEYEPKKNTHAPRITPTTRIGKR